VKAEYGKAIDATSWMTPETKRKAQEKLNRMKLAIGYSDWYTDYSTLNATFTDNDPINNLILINNIKYNHMINLAGIRIVKDKIIFEDKPTAAYVSKNGRYKNIIEIFLGIITPPYYYSSSDIAVHYGVPPGTHPDSTAVGYGIIGAVIGHEINHAFDREGRRFDESQNS
jgi:predicted metalloendopeptidase